MFDLTEALRQYLDGLFTNCESVEEVEKLEEEFIACVEFAAEERLEELEVFDE